AGPATSTAVRGRPTCRRGRSLVASPQLRRAPFRVCAPSARGRCAWWGRGSLRSESSPSSLEYAPVRALMWPAETGGSAGEAGERVRTQKGVGSRILREERGGEG